MNKEISSTAEDFGVPAEWVKHAENYANWKLLQPVEPVKPAGTPLADAQLLTILEVLDSSTKRLPPGFRQFARAIEAAHGIKPPRS